MAPRVRITACMQVKAGKEAECVAPCARSRPRTLAHSRPQRSYPPPTRTRILFRRYEASHNAGFWPEMGALLAAHGAHNYSISLHPGTRQLFAVRRRAARARAWSAVARYGRASSAQSCCVSRDNGNEGSCGAEW